LRASLNESVDHDLFEHAPRTFLAASDIHERQLAILNKTIQRVAGHVQAFRRLPRT
jgi:hypothetical protein